MALVVNQQLLLNPPFFLFSTLLPLFLIHIMHLNSLCFSNMAVISRTDQIILHAINMLSVR